MTDEIDLEQIKVGHVPSMLASMTPEQRDAMTDLQRKKIVDRLMKDKTFFTKQIKSLTEEKGLLMEKQDKLLKTWLSIGGGGLIAVLALMGQMLSAKNEMAYWLIIPSLFFAAIILIVAEQMKDGMNSHIKALEKISKEVEEASGTTSIFSSEQYLFKSRKSIMHWTFYGGVISIVMIFVIHALKAFQG